MDAKLYYYRATVTDVYDGDTCTVDIDLGLHTWLHGEKVRLHRINTPEIIGAERAAAIKAREFLRSQILGKTVLLHTIEDKKEKYGRYLGEIWIQRGGNDWVNVNDLMVSSGNAKFYNAANPLAAEESPAL